MFGHVNRLQNAFLKSLDTYGKDLFLSEPDFLLTNYGLKRSLYVKLKDWMSNSVDPDETVH